MDYNARYYSPLLGRFISPDPIVPEPTYSEAWNRYAYVFNNSLNYIDPSGHASCASDDQACWDSRGYRAFVACTQINEAALHALDFSETDVREVITWVVENHQVNKSAIYENELSEDLETLNQLMF